MRNEIDDLIDSAVDLDDDILLAMGDGEEHVFSSRYQNRMRQFYEKTGRRSRRGFPLHKRLAASILVAVLLAGTLTAGAFWPELISFFRTVHDKYTELNTISSHTPNLPDDHQILDNWDTYWWPSYLPEGYAFLSANDSSQRRIMLFSSEENDILCFEQISDVKSMFTDNEGTNIPGITVREFESYAFEKLVDDIPQRMLVWTDSIFSFSLSGSLSFNELVQIAEHIVYIETQEEKE